MKTRALHLHGANGGTNAIILLLFALLIIGIMLFLQHLNVEQLIMQ